MEKLLTDICKYTESKYDISFQFWGPGNNHCELKSKGSDITLFETNQHYTPIECVYTVLEWIYRVNRIKLVDRVCYNIPTPHIEIRVFKCLTEKYGAFDKDKDYHEDDVGKFGRRSALDWATTYPYDWAQVYSHTKT